MSHNFIYSILIALINNVDNIGVRIAYSIRGIKTSWPKNLWISVITFIISSAAAATGNVLSRLFDAYVSAVISMLLLTAMGIWVIIEPTLRKEPATQPKAKNKHIILDILQKPENADMNNSKDIDFKEATLLGIALSINNIGGSLSVGMIGINAVEIGLLSAGVSFMTLWAGNYLTGLCEKWNLGGKASVIAGIILIAIGIKQVI